MLTVIDHTEPDWRAAYVKKGRENGAATYSRQIVEHHLPVWERLVPDGTVISTCPVLSSVEVEGPLAVQYLHTYSYVEPLRQAELVVKNLDGRVDRVVFVTAYRSLHAQLVLAGFEALFVPMTVDPGPVRAARSTEAPLVGRRVLYFGNVTRPKTRLLNELKRTLEPRGWYVDVCSEGWLDGYRLSQRQAWEAASRYRYGIGVGRCALEMMALGLKVMVAGAEFGGLITTPDEWAVQQATNLNGRVTTFDRNIGACVEAFDLAIDEVPGGLDVATDAIVDGWARLG